MVTVADMSTAMDSRELFVEYQPIVLLSDASCIGAEALVRWRRADRIVQPSEFLRAINNTPLSGRLTYWVIDTAAAERDLSIIIVNWNTQQMLHDLSTNRIVLY